MKFELLSLKKKQFHTVKPEGNKLSTIKDKKSQWRDGRERNSMEYKVANSVTLNTAVKYIAEAH